jgi:tetratricopeptide (TPR) repeat protein
VDAEKALAPLSVSRIPGSESFYEHVHLNWDGNYQLALAFAQEATNCLPRNLAGIQNKGWADPRLCARRLGLTDWNRYTILDEIVKRLAEPPFTGQLNHEEQQVRLTNEMSEVRRRCQPQAAQAARVDFETELKEHPQDHWLHHNFAEFLTNTGDLPAATEQMRAVCDLLPENHAGYFQLGRLLALQKKYDEARSCLETSLRLRPDIFDVRVELGQVLAAQGKLEEALTEFDRAQRDHVEADARVNFLRADVLARQGKRLDSIASLREAIRLRPAYAEAHELLGMELALESHYPEAQEQFEEVVRLRPNHAEAHLNLGIALARQRRFGEALDHFATTLRIDPKNEQARGFIAKIKELQTQTASP